MPNYLVTGTLGAGKGIFAAKIAQDYLIQGRRVAANFDFFLEYMNPNGQEPVFRLPDHPRMEDFELLGRGCPDDDKVNKGALIFDECGTWLNCRDWNDKSRKAFINYVLHLRKFGWDVYFLVQNPELMDKQVISACAQFTVRCASWNDKVRFGFLSDLYDIYQGIQKAKLAKIARETGKPLQQLKKPFFALPQINIASTYTGEKSGSPSFTWKRDLVKTERYKPEIYYNYYDTNYEFKSGIETLGDKDVDLRASYSLLPGKTIRKFVRKCPDAYVIRDPAILTPKGVRPPVPWKSLLFFLFFMLPVSCYIIYYYFFSSDEPAPTEQSQPVSEPAKSSPTPEAKKTVPALPPPAEFRITGHSAKHTPQGVIYDYAIVKISGQDEIPFDYVYYGIPLAGIDGCNAQMKYKGQLMTISCL
ncbi:hypothetical protein IHE26_07330 [Plesiomonas shigelloides]|uniref:zonular occludens toxin domain-containing protein n=1 Tax=Plesiomonas shigelloides TaxID=703 RepID=UPI0017852B49|nr:zonular occludens toxin domain-containing protein [Plesiomonas shigelloides]QOH81062.1 hypothetical protein IHE26_07330 [Plesiomonas shigelloides]